MWVGLCPSRRHYTALAGYPSPPEPCSAPPPPRDLSPLLASQCSPAPAADSAAGPTTRNVRMLIYDLQSLPPPPALPPALRSSTLGGLATAPRAQKHTSPRARNDPLPAGPPRARHSGNLAEPAGPPVGRPRCARSTCRRSAAAAARSPSPLARRRLRSAGGEGRSTTSLNPFLLSHARAGRERASERAAPVRSAEVPKRDRFSPHNDRSRQRPRTVHGRTPRAPYTRCAGAPAAAAHGRSALRGQAGSWWEGTASSCARAPPSSAAPRAPFSRARAARACPQHPSSLRLASGGPARPRRPARYGLPDRRRRSKQRRALADQKQEKVK